MENKSFCSYLPKSTRRRKKRTKPQQAPTKSFVTFLNPKQIPVEQYERYEKKEDTKIQIDYADVNIFHIDSRIKHKLRTQISSVSELENDLKKLINIIQNTDDVISKTLASREITILRKRIQDLESSFELMLYTYRTTDLLDEFRDILLNSKSSFVMLETDNKVRQVEKRKSEIISSFLNIAQEYIDILNYQQKPEKMICENCNGVNLSLAQDDTIYICENCGVEIEIFDDSPSYKDTDRVNMSSRYTYSKKGHFLDAIKHFQGIQNTDPKRIQNVVVILIDEIKKHNLTPKNVTKAHIYMFLNEQDLSKHYEDLNLLHHIITGEPCPDISTYEKDLIDLFEKLEEAYAKVQSPDRVNSLNVYYKLYKLLQKLGYKCSKADFCILKTQNKEDEHDEKMKEAWDILGWEWIET